MRDSESLTDSYYFIHNKLHNETKRQQAHLKETYTFLHRPFQMNLLKLQIAQLNPRPCHSTWIQDSNSSLNSSTGQNFTIH